MALDKQTRIMLEKLEAVEAKIDKLIELSTKAPTGKGEPPTPNTMKAATAKE